MKKTHWRRVVAPTGIKKVCKTWQAEAAYRMLQNNLDPAVAENPEELVVYGGRGKAARDWLCLEEILESLKSLEADETLLIQSGKPVGILSSHTDAPRVLIANSNLVPKWATQKHFDELENAGLMMFGQMTAGSWIYIGTQGILQGTHETFSACGRKHFNCSPLPLSGKTVLSGGLGGMGGAQPLAAKLAGAAFLGVDVSAARVQKRLETGYLDFVADSIDSALELLFQHSSQKSAFSIGLVGNIVDILEYIKTHCIIIDVLTDQTSAHDPLNGYIPNSISLKEAELLRTEQPDEYMRLSLESMAKHVSLLLYFKSQGSTVFDYGNNIRAFAKEGGCHDAFKIPGFVPEYIRPMFCEGNGPFRWVALSGDPEDIYVTDQALLELFPEDQMLAHWLKHGVPHIQFQGLPARICWLKYGQREEAGVLFNSLVRDGKVTAPIVIGRDHLDCGSVASPNRETEQMKDGSDAVADWPFLNAMINSANGASWVSIHQGGGVGVGYSQHAGMVIVADGTPDAEVRLRRVLRSDPATGVIRHADAGYETAKRFAEEAGIKMPMLKKEI